MRKVFHTSILVGLGFFFSYQTIFATPPIKESKKMEMNLNFSSEPELNKEFTMTFTFKPLEDIPHINELDDQAEIAFDEEIELVSGQTKWEGKLRKGDVVTIQVVLKPITEGIHTIHGNVGSCQIDPRFISEDPLLKMKTGMKYYGKRFRYHNGTVKQFKNGETENKIETNITDIRTGEKKKINMEGYSSPPFGQSVIIDSSLSPKESEELNNKRNIVRSLEKEYGIPLKRGKETSDSISNNNIMEIKLGKELSVIIFLYNQENGKIVKTLWRCEPENSCRLEILPDDKIRVTSLNSHENYLIIGIYRGCEYRFKISNLSTSYRISGHFQYVDNWGNNNDMMEMLVSSEYKSGGNWYVESWTCTDMNGLFSVYTVGHDTMRFMVWSCHIADYDTAGWIFTTSDHHLDGGDQMLLYIFGPAYLHVFQDYMIPESDLICNATSHTGAYEITNVIRKGYYRVKDVNWVGWWYRPHFSYAYWDNIDNSVTSSYTRRIVVYDPPDTMGIIMIQGAAVPYESGERDQWDWGIILHEYGHFIMDWYAQFPPIQSSYVHIYYLPPSIYPTYISWVEGWANFFACYALSLSYMEISSYTNRLNNNSVLFTIDLETPEPDVPYWNRSYDQWGPSSDTALYNGYNVEGSIAEALWDIYDEHNDNNYYVSSELRGHNDDYNQYDSWRGINAIWDVFENYDPAPSNPNHNYCYDFYEFIKGWKDKLYPFEGHFSDILCSHNIEPTANNVPNISGEVNSDGNVSIADIVYLINYLFKLGPGFEPVWKGDTNGDCKVSVGDVVYLINYLFKGGPTPTCNDSCWPCRCPR